MEAETALLLLVGLLIVEGSDDFEERKKFHGKFAHKIVNAGHEVDEDYEYYLWKKYGKGKLGKTIQEESLSSGPSVQYRKNSDTYSSYYSSPSYSYGYPAYNYASSYPYYSSGYGYGYPSTGSYGYGIPWLGNGLFSLGFGRGLDIMTPIGGFGIGSGFSIGIG
ncbi:unnamed protein product [Haemonchus placei]|uniref:Prisilkin-39-like n=1 Tax=Haemonchus placei TaxID=6290 RepID=A0A0N4WKE1_HAEPC|nr:unnamed protein product [Haemonchus placei]